MASDGSNNTPKLLVRTIDGRKHLVVEQSANRQWVFDSLACPVASCEWE